MFSATLALLVALQQGNNINELQDLDIRSRIEIHAQAHQVDPMRMLALAKCESGLNPNAWNKTDPYGGAKGLFQWLEPTWHIWEKKYGAELDIWDYKDQIKLTSFALATGKWNMWSCTKKIPASTLTYNK